MSREPANEDTQGGGSVTGKVNELLHGTPNLFDRFIGGIATFFVTAVWSVRTVFDGLFMLGRYVVTSTVDSANFAAQNVRYYRKLWGANISGRIRYGWDWVAKWGMGLIGFTAGLVSGFVIRPIATVIQLSLEIFLASVKGIGVVCYQVISPFVSGVGALIYRVAQGIYNLGMRGWNTALGVGLGVKYFWRMCKEILYSCKYGLDKVGRYLRRGVAVIVANTGYVPVGLLRGAGHLIGWTAVLGLKVFEFLMTHVFRVPAMLVALLLTAITEGARKIVRFIYAGVKSVLGVLTVIGSALLNTAEWILSTLLNGLGLLGDGVLSLVGLLTYFVPPFVSAVKGIAKGFVGLLALALDFIIEIPLRIISWSVSIVCSVVDVILTTGENVVKNLMIVGISIAETLVNIASWVGVNTVAPIVQSISGIITGAGAALASVAGIAAGIFSDVLSKMFLSFTKFFIRFLGFMPNETRSSGSESPPEDTYMERAASTIREMWSGFKAIFMDASLRKKLFKKTSSSGNNTFVFGSYNWTRAYAGSLVKLSVSDSLSVIKSAFARWFDSSVYSGVRSLRGSNELLCQIVKKQNWEIEKTFNDIKRSCSEWRTEQLGAVEASWTELTGMGPKALEWIRGFFIGSGKIPSGMLLLYNSVITMIDVPNTQTPGVFGMWNRLGFRAFFRRFNIEIPMASPVNAGVGVGEATEADNPPTFRDKLNQIGSALMSRSDGMLMQGVRHVIRRFKLAGASDGSDEEEKIPVAKKFERGAENPDLSYIPPVTKKTGTGGIKHQTANDKFKIWDIGTVASSSANSFHQYMYSGDKKSDIVTKLDDKYAREDIWARLKGKWAGWTEDANDKRETRSTSRKEMMTRWDGKFKTFFIKDGGSNADTQSGSKLEKREILFGNPTIAWYSRSDIKESLSARSHYVDNDNDRKSTMSAMLALMWPKDDSQGEVKGPFYDCTNIPKKIWGAMKGDVIICHEEGGGYSLKAVDIRISETKKNWIGQNEDDRILSLGEWKKMHYGQGNDAVFRLTKEVFRPEKGSSWWQEFIATITKNYLPNKTSLGSGDQGRFRIFQNMWAAMNERYKGLSKSTNRARLAIGGLIRNGFRGLVKVGAFVMYSVAIVVSMALATMARVVYMALRYLALSRPLRFLSDSTFGSGTQYQNVITKTISREYTFTLVNVTRAILYPLHDIPMAISTIGQAMWNKEVGVSLRKIINATWLRSRDPYYQGAGAGFAQLKNSTWLNELGKEVEGQPQADAGSRQKSHPQQQASEASVSRQRPSHPPLKEGAAGSPQPQPLKSKINAADSIIPSGAGFFGQPGERKRKQEGGIGSAPGLGQRQRQSKGDGEQG